ncbi:hypothetical protein Lal_00037712 [Lupinus albus]|nr:hypothetical protein Lal_00037712 [Lupinus albus]
MKAVNDGNGGTFFLYGYGGTGKTFIWKTLASVLRSENHIVLTVASSGIASLLLPGGGQLTPSWPYQFLHLKILHATFIKGVNLQRQSLASVGLYLPRPVFGHGQLYVAFSRIQSMEGLKILIHDNEGKTMNTKINVVYKEVFQNL